VRRSRYTVTDAWMPETIDFSIAKGKKLLEVGHGLGSDLLTFAEHGADVSGVDITDEHHRMASRNFELHGRPVVLKLCDAANLAFESNVFDVVYSHGVLHHTPDTVRCISEIYRVLKPGGTMILTLYYTFSAFHIFSKIIAHGLVRGDLFRLGYRGLMATLEYGADGKNTKPLVKTYSKRELRCILQDFTSVRFRIAHFKRDHIPVLGTLIPPFLERPLSRLAGWYVVAVAVK
jgi:ubiquinone/menaquinone biosynthesis C-methylase UbiE